MDGKKDWGWFKLFMPGVAALLAEYREFGEGLHIDECWRRGVLRCEPGWFYAREGPIALGTPFDRRASPVQCTWGELDWRRAGLVLMLAPLPGGGECRRLNLTEKGAWAVNDARSKKEAHRRQTAGEVYGAN